MRILAIKTFFKKYNKLLRSNIITKEQFEITKKLFKNNINDQKIRVHKINCKNKQTILSITIPNTQIRILANYRKCDGEYIAIFIWIGKHKEYEIIIKDKRNCKFLFLDCDDI